MLTNAIVTGLIILRDRSSGSDTYYCFCALPFASFVPHFALCNAQQPAQQTCFELQAWRKPRCMKLKQVEKGVNQSSFFRS